MPAAFAGIIDGGVPSINNALLLLSLPFLLCHCGAPGGGPSLISGGKPDATLAFLPEKAEQGLIFRTYRAKRNVWRRDNWTRRFDVTGISWNDIRAATLISPRYVVMAAHFTRPADVPVVFHDNNGVPHERHIVAVRNLNGHDVAVAKLDAPAPAGVRPYKLANATDATLGRIVIVTDKTGSLSVHRIGAVQGPLIQFDFVPYINPVYSHILVAGDSGRPSFVMKNGELYLLETHTTGGPGAGPFYGDPGLQAALQAAMADMDR